MTPNPTDRTGRAYEAILHILAGIGTGALLYLLYRLFEVKP